MSLSITTTDCKSFFVQDHRIIELLSFFLPNLFRYCDSQQLKSDQSPLNLFNFEFLIDLIRTIYEESKSGTSKNDPNSILFCNNIQSSIDKINESLLSISDFEMLKLIGKGAFGEVHLVKYKENCQVRVFLHSHLTIVV